MKHMRCDVNCLRNLQCHCSVGKLRDCPHARTAFRKHDLWPMKGRAEPPLCNYRRINVMTTPGLFNNMPKRTKCGNQCTL